MGSKSHPLFSCINSTSLLLYTSSKHSYSPVTYPKHSKQRIILQSEEKGKSPTTIMSTTLRTSKTIVAASVGIVEALKDQGICWWNTTIRSIHQQAKTQFRSCSQANTKLSSSSSSAQSRVRHEKLKSEESLRTDVLELLGSQLRVQPRTKIIYYEKPLLSTWLHIAWADQVNQDFMILTLAAIRAVLSL